MCGRLGAADEIASADLAGSSGGRSRCLAAATSSDRAGVGGQQGRQAAVAQPVRGAKRELELVQRRHACGPIVTVAVRAEWWVPQSLGSAACAAPGRRRTRAAPRWAGPEPPGTAHLPRGEGHARARSQVHHPPQSCRRRDGLQGTHEIRRRLQPCVEMQPTAAAAAPEQSHYPASRGLRLSVR